MSWHELKLTFPMVRTGTGAEVWTRRLADRLADRGHRITLRDVAHKYQYIPWVAPVRIPSQTDVVIANSWSAAAFARKGIPLVSVCHLVVQDPLLSPFKSFAQSLFHDRFVTPMERAAARRADVNVAVSGYVARQMSRLLGFDDVTVIENAVDTDFFSPRDCTVERAEIFRLLFVGNPSLRKGFDVIARVMDILGTRAHLTCVGPEPGPSLPKPKATYTGPLDRHGVRAAYLNADLLLFPSRAEGFGYAAAEALSCGLPVLCSAGTAVAEIVGQDCAITCRPDDAIHIAKECLELAQCPSNHGRMRKAARAHACTRFSEERWVDAFETMLLELHNSDRRRR